MLTRERLIGILITIAFHLLLALVIVTIRIRDLQLNNETRLDINIASEVVDKPKDDQKTEEVNREVLEKIYEELHRQESVDHGNTSVNMSEKFKDDISTEKYMQRMQNELGVKNNQTLDQQGQKPKLKVLEDLTSESKEDNSIRSLSKNPPIKGKKVFYNGPTNIYYDLKGRYEVNMVIPVYKCEGSGTVVVDIIVDQQGSVVNTSINREKSRSEECFIDAAYKAASESRFNIDNKAQPRQIGMITYQFVAQ